MVMAEKVARVCLCGGGTAGRDDGREGGRGEGTAGKELRSG